MQRMAMVLALVVAPVAAAEDVQGFGLRDHWGITGAQVTAV